MAEIGRRLDRPAPSGPAEERDRRSARLIEIAESQQRPVEREGSIPSDIIESRVNALEAEEAAVRPRLVAVEPGLARASNGKVRLDNQAELVRRLGPRLADPDFEPQALVLRELGVRVSAGRRVKTLEWGLPLPAGDKSGWTLHVDRTGIGEPTPEQDAETARLSDEARREALDEGR